MASAVGPEAGRLAEPQVEAMFDRVSGVYDRMNSIMSAGLHHHWRTRAVDRLDVGPGDRVLDVATGTGDLAIELASRGCEVIGSDFSEPMLALAREKAPRIEFVQGNALALDYPDASFDAVTVGFGARNYSDLERGIAEMARVAKPGGRVLILEMTTPTKPPLSTFYSAWFDRVVPKLGRFAGNSDAYTYLPNSVKRFPDAQALAAKFAAAGLEQVRYVLTAGGIIATHVGVKPGG